MYFNTQAKTFGLLYYVGKNPININAPVFYSKSMTGQIQMTKIFQQRGSLQLRYHSGEKKWTEVYKKEKLLTLACPPFLQSVVFFPL